MNQVSKSSHLKSLGQTGTKYDYTKVSPELLETFPRPSALSDLKLHIEAPEFTSLCPKTGQPDFATIVIDYEPKDHCVESKSLKLYLGSFRMVGEFHEACVQRICEDLVNLLNPKWLKVEGRFTPRGGIPFWPTAEWYR